MYLFENDMIKIEVFKREERYMIDVCFHYPGAPPSSDPGARLTLFYDQGLSLEELKEMANKLLEYCHKQ